ncbi:TonB-dependent siderophore receptor [Herbaspirillum chlorophenolicum]|uniref:TonB-dependent siderophore receptor n=1 Tax=Herbaspirillum chlorophenolicum TaxID=211589 RepID=UPI00067C0A4E|nr:TonB-dependent siderophore receptor [Herbaspirillum chlorophenolicum]
MPCDRLHSHYSANSSSSRRRVMRFHPLMLAVRVACLGIGASTVAAPVQAQVRQVASYDIPAGPLADALNRFAQQANVAIVMDASSLKGLQSQGLKGSYSVEEGFGALLKGSGHAAARTAAGYVVRPAAAGAVGAAAPLPEVRVSADAETDIAGGGYVARRAVTATKTDTPLLEVPQSVSVITAQEAEDKGATTLTDALAQTPGVLVNPYGFDSRAPDWVILRGFDGWYTGSYRDGLIQNVGLTFLGVQTEMYGLERIEVLRGPSSVMFGKGDAGGVVNRVSKLPSADAPREIVAQLGSFDRRQIAADVGGKIDEDGKLLFRVVGLDLDTGTQEQYPNGERMKRKRQYLAPSLRWQISPQTSLVLQAEILRDDASDDVQFVTGANGQPTSVKEGDPTYSRIKTNTDAFGYQLEHLFGGGWALRQKARYAYRSMDKHHIQSSLDTDGVTLLRQARHDVESVNDLAIDTSLSGDVMLGATAHKLLVGVDYSRARANWRRDTGAAPSLDMNNPIYGITIPEPQTPAGDIQQTSTQLGIYAQDQVALGEAWRLTVGGRYDSVKSDNNDRFNSIRTTQNDEAFSGRIGINYLVGNGWAPYVSHAESFLPNVGVDAAGRAFTPSHARQDEIGIKYMPADGSVSFSAALFDLNKSGVVSYDPNTFEARQIGKVRSRGLELEGKAALTKRLKMTASFTALNMQVRESADPSEIGKMPILTPRRSATLWFDYAADAWLPGVSVGAGVRHFGKTWDDAANTSSQPGYTLVDGALRYETGPWKFALNATNLFDRRYFVGHAYGSFYRGAERNIMLTAKYSF